MAHLHEILAVEKDLEGNSARTIKETAGTFSKREHLFTGYVKRHEIFDEELKASQQKADEVKKVDSTVQEVLDYMAKIVTKSWDASFQKEEANTRATADIVVGGKVLVENVPATFLLTMERRLSDLFSVFNGMPTLAPGIRWQEDATADKSGIFVTTDDEESFQKVRKTDYKTVAPATEHHPAQVVPVEVEETIGKYIKTSQSGMLTPVAKAEILNRLSELQRAVKKARQRANSTNVDNSKMIGDVFFDYIFKG